MKQLHESLMYVCGHCCEAVGRFESISRGLDLQEEMGQGQKGKGCNARRRSHTVHHCRRQDECRCAEQAEKDGTCCRRPGGAERKIARNESSLRRRPRRTSKSKKDDADDDDEEEADPVNGGATESAADARRRRGAETKEISEACRSSKGKHLIATQAGADEGCSYNSQWRVGDERTS
ncbi:hypothetical protein MRB53_037359 [Persea americana]|nr:hypothetical protein MRB53_037359 [Persea americana]